MDVEALTPQGAAPRHDSQGEGRHDLDDSHLLAHGRNADVYLLNDTQVLRRLRQDADTYPNLGLMLHLNAVGYPTARVVSSNGPDMVMERLDGATLLQALDARVVTMAEGVRILLDLHDRLHALPLPPSDGAPGHRGPDDCIVHLDLHPANVLMTSSGPYVIDWEAAGFGPPELDLATTAIVFGEIVADGNEYAAPALAMLRAYLQQAGPALGSQVAAAASLRAGHTTFDADEIELIPEARVVVERELARL